MRFVLLQPVSSSSAEMAASSYSRMHTASCTGSALQTVFIVTSSGNNSRATRGKGHSYLSLATIVSTPTVERIWHFIQSILGTERPDREAGDYNALEVYSTFPLRLYSFGAQV